MFRSIEVVLTEFSYIFSLIAADQCNGCNSYIVIMFFPFSLSLSFSLTLFPPSLPLSPPNCQVAGGSHAREVSYANFKAFNQFLGNLDIMERIVHSVAKSDPTAKITHGKRSIFL